MQFLKRLYYKLMMPKPSAIARQLRKPSGSFGRKVALKMNENNGILYHWLLEKMPVTQGDRILEIGFGNGMFFRDIIHRGKEVKMAGVDYSETMVQEATANNQDLIKDKKLELHHGNSDSLPFASSSFDKVFCINVVYFWERPSAHLAEIHRVLKPGGVFYTLIRSKASLQNLPFTKYGFTMYEKEEWENILSENGFEILQTERLDETARTIDGTEFNLDSFIFPAVKR